MSIGINELKAALAKMPKPVQEACSKALTTSHLNLQNQNISYQALKDTIIPFVCYNRIKSLNLKNNYLCEKSARLIAKKLIRGNRFLTILDLGFNQLGAEGARVIADALTENAVLRTLKLCSNEVGSVGAYWLSKAITVNETLSTLDLWNNNVGVEGANAMKEALMINNALKKLELGDGFRRKSIDNALIVIPLEQELDMQAYLRRNTHQHRMMPTNQMKAETPPIVFGYLNSKSQQTEATGTKVLQNRVTEKICPKQ